MTLSFNSLQITKEISNIINESSAYGDGVKVLAHFLSKTKEISIDYLYVPVLLRRQNIATEILKEFQVLADATGVILKILPSSDFGTPHLVLVNLYASAGFGTQHDSEYMFYRPI
jgi:hypothetical protein